MNYNFLYKNLATRIEKLRRKQGMTQEQLAEKVRISRAYMGYIEQGRNAPSLEVLERIAKALKVSMKDFFSL